MEKFIVTSSPHFHRNISVRAIMGDVLIALVPAAIASVIYFGIRSLIIIATCIIAAVASEFIFNLCIKKTQTVGDLSAAVRKLYDLTPKGIIDTLRLLNIDYEKLSEGCHFRNSFGSAAR